MRGRARSVALVAACGATAAAFSQPAFSRGPRLKAGCENAAAVHPGWREGAPWALASSPALRRLSLSNIVCTAIITDLARASIAVHAPAAIISTLLRTKASILLPSAVVADDRVVLELSTTRSLATTALGSRMEALVSSDDVVDVAVESITELGCRPAALVVSPDIFVSPAVLERYGVALVAGMRLWKEYMASLAVVSPAPVPNNDSVLARDDCERLDRLMVILGQLCEVARNLNFDIALCLSHTESVSTRQSAMSKLSLQATSQSCTTRKSAGFHRAVAVAHIATCLARAYADPDAEKGVFPSLLLSADSTNHIHAVELLADQTLVKLSLRLAPTTEYSTQSSAYTECSSLEPAVLAVPGLQNVPAGITFHPPVVEYTRGIGDLQTARLRAAVQQAARDDGPGPHALVRREFAGARNQLHAAAARSPLARTALAAESRALWTRARMLAYDAVGFD